MATHTLVSPTSALLPYSAMGLCSGKLAAGRFGPASRARALQTYGLSTRLSATYSGLIHRLPIPSPERTSIHSIETQVHAATMFCRYLDIEEPHLALADIANILQVGYPALASRFTSPDASLVDACADLDSLCHASCGDVIWLSNYHLGSCFALIDGGNWTAAYSEARRALYLADETGTPPAYSRRTLIEELDKYIQGLASSLECLPDGLREDALSTDQFALALSNIFAWGPKYARAGLFPSLWYVTPGTILRDFSWTLPVPATRALPDSGSVHVFEVGSVPGPSVAGRSEAAAPDLADMEEVALPPDQQPVDDLPPGFYSTAGRSGAATPDLADMEEEVALPPGQQLADNVPPGFPSIRVPCPTVSTAGSL